MQCKRKVHTVRAEPFGINESRRPGCFSSQSTATHSRQRQEFVVVLSALGGFRAEVEPCPDV